jgi:UDP-N-acetylglucosamine 2-epimerase (non-hydrolysing)
MNLNGAATGISGDRTTSRTVWLVGGTRPEALKLAPLAQVLHRQPTVRPVIVATGQHPSMFHQGLAAFGLEPDRDIRLRRETGTPAELTAQLTPELDGALAADTPAAVVVQGDTSTALVGALAAFWRRIPVTHLEAGLRSHDLAAPFPEEANRKLISQVAALHLAPTTAAAMNLAAEGIPEAGVEVVGNTVVDAVLTVADRSTRFTHPGLGAAERGLADGQRLVLVTVHRRESWGEPLRAVLAAVRDLLAAHPDITAVLPVHPNPVVRADVMSVLGDHPRVVIIDPLDYPDLVWVLARSTLVLSDSGGIQEEAPSFGVPVLVLREVTERTEAVDAGCALLLGTDRERIVSTAGRLLDDDAARVRMTSRGNPFGDGHAADRAAQAIAGLIGLGGAGPVGFDPARPGPARGRVR